MKLRDSELTEELLREIPKAELHIHIEGSLEPEMMFEIAGRNGVRLRYGSVREVREAYDFSDLQSFLDLYYEGTQVLLYERDFYDLTWSYLRKASSQGVRHAEIFFDPQAHTDRGLDLGTVITGLRRALKDGERRLGMSSHLIMCFLRHLSAGEAMETLRQVLPYKEWIVGVGLDSSEVGHPPDEFEAVFEEAGRHGFRRVAHAGEEGPPEYIRQALDDLGAARIDHGGRCGEGPGLPPGRPRPAGCTRAVLLPRRGPPCEIRAFLLPRIPPRTHRVGARLLMSRGPRRRSTPCRAAPGVGPPWPPRRSGVSRST